MEEFRSIEPGLIIVSEPLLIDKIFKRSVILITDHQEGSGSMGFILNKPTAHNVADVINNSNEREKPFPKFNSSLYFGGPTDAQSLYYLHTIGKKIEGSILVKDNIYVGGNFEQLTEMIAEKKVSTKSVRFFAGYSSWDADQLEDELENDYWLILKSTRGLCFPTEPVKLWQNILKNIGGMYSVFADGPEYPTWN